MTLAAEPVKVGVMDQQLVIERSKAGKRALEDLKAYSATRQKIISARRSGAEGAGADDSGRQTQ